MNKPNRLINEKSPYLLQHAYNPVDWYPWGHEAFKKAEEEDKPIFLSIGYSTCHWCHVMEKESFEDEEVASLMNDAFISIKVDREERPDIDGIYMSVCQMMTGGGGWPLTVLMTHDKKPFFSGTYFPKKNRFGRIGMLELVPRIKEVWLNKREDILRSADEITKAISLQSSAFDSETLDENTLDNAFEQLKRRFDPEMGGFGSAPKFPSPHNLLFLLRYWKRSKSQAALDMVETTLKKMYMGGIYDHIGFGFARYSTDRTWLVPHFEKMLYDQAMLTLAYTEAFQVTKNIFYKNVAAEILKYVLRDMTHPEGGFYSAEDADSEGEEGKFYLWDYDELLMVLDKYESDMAIKIFGVEKDGNWIDESKGLMDGTNILHLKKSYSEFADEFGLGPDQLEKKINIIKKKLFEYRKKRIHPYKDDKILTDWNGLMISAFAKAGAVFNEPKYISAAEKAYQFIEMKLKLDNGKLLHRFRDEEAGLTAHIDDYAFMIKASIDLYEATFDPDYLVKAISLNNLTLSHFWCKESGGFYFTADYNEHLIARQKEIYDGAIPSGNSIQLINLIKLARITLNMDLENFAGSLTKAFSAEINRNPSYYTQFLCGLDFTTGPSYEVIIASNKNDKSYFEIIDHLRLEYYPEIVLLNKTKDYSEKLEKLIPAAVNNNPINNKTTVYICKNFICNLPVFSSAEISELIN